MKIKNGVCSGCGKRAFLCDCDEISESPRTVGYVRIYEDGQPCKHHGCKNHISHPCEGCGRTGARGVVDLPRRIYQNWKST